MTGRSGKVLDFLARIRSLVRDVKVDRDPQLSAGDG